MKRVWSGLLVGLSLCGCDDGGGGAVEPALDAVDVAGEADLGGMSDARVDVSMSSDSGPPPDGGPAFALEALSGWQRHGRPILRDHDPSGVYEVAADPHVFRAEDGTLRMVYSGPQDGPDLATIKLATGRGPTDWTVTGVLLPGGESNAGGLDANRETAFYRRARSGRHQIYYIGYADEEEYAAQIFVAEADAIEGPYVLPDAPVIAVGEQAGNSVALMTSPSVVEHEGRLFMVYCAWDAFPEPSAVWVHGAVSDDDGQTWTVVGEVDVPSCMEGALTVGPDGHFYGVGQGVRASLSDAARRRSPRRATRCCRCRSWSPLGRRGRPTR